MNTFNLIFDEGSETSYRSLLMLAEEGSSVMRSPHAPLSSHNLGAAMLGFDTVIYGDTYVGSSGTNKEQLRNDPLKIGDANVAETPSIKTMTRFVDASLNGFNATKLTDLHAEVSAAVIGGNITTWHKFVLAHRDLYANIIELALEQGHGFKDSVNTVSGVWARWQQERATIEDVLDVIETRDGIFQAVATLECKLVCMFVAQALSSKKDRVYHLAGRDMVGYLPSKVKRIEAIVDGLRQRGFLEKLEVVIVPIAGTSVVALEGDVEKLNEMWRLSGSRDSESKKKLRQLLQTQSLRQAMARKVGVSDSARLGGGGIAIVEEALNTPLAHIRQRLNKHMTRTV